MIDTKDSIQISNGCDWLTVTTTSGADTSALIQTVREIEYDHLPEDAIPKEWAAMGYKGQNYGPMKFGRRGGEEAIFIVSGDFAENIASEYVLPHDRVTRIDLQVTVALEVADDGVAYRLQSEFSRLQSTAKYAKLWTYHSSPKGDTFAVGSRGSGVYVRLYDKSVDAGFGEAGRAWRYEVEYKGNHAKKVALNLNRTGDRWRYCASQTLAEFTKRGVRPKYSVVTPISAIECGANVTTAGTKLSWLERNVAPVVTQLVHLGYEKEVISAIQLEGVYKKWSENAK